MNERAKNIAVGITVLGALGMLCGMIVIFAGLPQMFQRGQELKIIFPSTGDAHEGDAVHMAGMRVGRITDIRFAEGDPRKGVVFTVRIDSGVKIPGNVTAYIFTRGFVGGAYLELKPEGPARRDPQTGQVLEHFPADWSEPIRGQVKGSGMFPDEMKNAFLDLSKLAKNLNAAIAPAEAPSTSPATTTAPAGGGIRGAITTLITTLNDIRDVLDEENRRNIKTSFANLAKASSGAIEAMDAMKNFAAEANVTMKKVGDTADAARTRIDELTSKLIEDAEKISALMTTINKAAMKVESGKGTAGKLLNDPALYNNLMAAAKQMEKMLEDFRGLLKEWKDNGVKADIKLK